MNPVIQMLWSFSIIHTFTVLLVFLLNQTMKLFLKTLFFSSYVFFISSGDCQNPCLPPAETEALTDCHQILIWALPDVWFLSRHFFNAQLHWGAVWGVTRGHQPELLHMMESHSRTLLRARHPQQQCHLPHPSISSIPSALPISISHLAFARSPLASLRSATALITSPSLFSMTRNDQPSVPDTLISSSLFLTLRSFTHTPVLCHLLCTPLTSSFLISSLSLMQPSRHCVG